MDNEIAYFEIFPWNKNFETGIESIDEQHKTLVDILNRLAGNLVNLSEDVILNEIFDELATYADFHFKTEERIWDRYYKDDDWNVKHHSTHGSFIEEVIEIKNNKDGRALDDVVYDIVSFLSKWLAYHILDTDKRMAMGVIEMMSGVDIDQSKSIADIKMQGSMRVIIETVLSMYNTLSTRTLDLMREKTLRKKAEKKLKLSEERWQFILEGGSEDLFDWCVDDYEVNYSDKDVSIFDTVCIKSKSSSYISKIHPLDVERVENDFKNHLDGKTDSFINKHRVLQDNGSWSWVLSRVKVVSRDSDGKALRMIGTHSDITERELASLIYKNSSQAMIISDLENKIISVNPAFTKITGYEPEDVIGHNPNILGSGEQSETFYKNMWDSINRDGYWSGEIINKRKNGDKFAEMLNINSVINSDGSVDHYVALFNDITEKKKADELIIEHANYDQLTKVQNRRMFKMSLQQEIQRSNRSSTPLALLFIDLDHFKDVNDSLGHNIGDDLLVEVANRLRLHVRESDVISRIGGDEFTIILSDVNGSIGVDRLSQDIIHSLSQPFQIGTEQIYISASIGIALYPNDADNDIKLLQNADQAMYLAKKSGRNAYRYFTLSMQEAAQKRQILIRDLHIALELNQFELYYQPIVDLKTGIIRKAEALIRWNHPTRGLVSPDNFIHLAEETGLIIEIGEWVFTEAMKQTKIWKEKFGVEFQTSINKSPVQFRSITDITDWIAYLNKNGLSGKNVVVEITENLFMENENIVLEKLLQLRDAGIEVSLDDFGTGYSSLSYLRKFDIDYIKIDKSFITSLTMESDDFALCEAMIVMAKKLNIKVIAEGIETEVQRKLLFDIDCDYGQGYLFSRPVPANEFEKLFEK